MSLGSVKRLHRQFRARTADALKSVIFHRAVIVVIIFDAILSLVDVGHSTLHPECGDRKSPKWLDILAEVSFGLTCLFMAEVALTLWALGAQWFNPFGKVPFAVLHLFDAAIVVTTFVLEIVLHGTDRELASLLVILRLWRLVKLVGGIAVASGDMSEEQAQELHDLREELKETNRRLAETQEELHALKNRT